MLRVLIITIAVFLNGCVAGGYGKFYTPYLDLKTASDVEPLKVDEKPKLVVSEDLERDLMSFLAKKYVVVGSSAFNGELQSTNFAINQAKKIGATLVLVNSEFTNTQSSV